MTYRTAQDGFTVYRLVTKLKFNVRPTVEDYDAALHHLTTDFKKKNHVKLVCSPIGCMRDKISLCHFANNLAKFQREKGISDYYCIQ